MLKIFDHPLNEKFLKTYNAFASRQRAHSAALFSIVQSSTFVLTWQYRHTSQNDFHAQVTQTSAAKIYENINPETGTFEEETCTEFQTFFDLMKQIKVSIEVYGAIISDISDIEVLKTNLMDIMLQISFVQFSNQGENGVTLVRGTTMCCHNTETRFHC